MHFNGRFGRALFGLHRAFWISGSNYTAFDLLVSIRVDDAVEQKGTELDRFAIGVVMSEGQVAIEPVGGVGIDELIGIGG